MGANGESSTGEARVSEGRATTKEARVALRTEAATLALGTALSGYLVHGDVIALSGELGAGKTTLARGVIAGLARLSGQAQEAVPSPSFPLVQMYEFGSFVLWHFDLFRIASPAELVELGWEEALGEGATLVEWPERAPGFLPDPTLAIRLEWEGEGRLALLSGRLNLISLANLVATLRTHPELS
jgi:tRNA threonylcarbamoyl adenosine modification protein YjeE